MLPRQEHLGLLVAVARRRIKQAVLLRARAHRLSAQQFWVLVSLHERPGASQGELVDALRIDAPTASRVLAALVRRKLVRAEADPSDRRRLRLALTATGAALAARLAEAAAEVRSAAEAGLTPADLDALRRGLQRMIDNLERLDAPEARRTRTGSPT